jgi:hypothetical protein
MIVETAPTDIGSVHYFVDGKPIKRTIHQQALRSV